MYCRSGLDDIEETLKLAERVAFSSVSSNLSLQTTPLRIGAFKLALSIAQQWMDMFAGGQSSELCKVQAVHKKLTEMMTRVELCAVLERHGFNEMASTLLQSTDQDLVPLSILRQLFEQHQESGRVLDQVSMAQIVWKLIAAVVRLLHCFGCHHTMLGTAYCAMQLHVVRTQSVVPHCWKTATPPVGWQRTWCSLHTRMT